MDLIEKVCTYCFKRVKMGEPHDLSSCAEHLREMVIEAGECISQTTKFLDMMIIDKDLRDWLAKALSNIADRLSDRGHAWLDKYGKE